MRDQFCVLIDCLRIGSFGSYIAKILSVLSLVSRDHIDGLLDQVEIVLLVRCRWTEIEIAINESLRASIKESVYVGLVPTALFYRLELTVEIVKPLPNVSLIRFESIIPWRVVERQGELEVIKFFL